MSLLYIYKNVNQEDNAVCPDKDNGVFIFPNCSEKNLIVKKKMLCQQMLKIIDIQEENVVSLNT